MAKNGVWVFYFLQGEDGDCVESPNAFNVSSAANEVRLGQFLQHFPLRGHGEYHFRFRAPDQLSGYCWMDVSDPSVTLPRYDNVICAKALRLDRLPKPRSSRLRRKAPYGAPAGIGERSGGTTSWRKEQAQRRMFQDNSDARHGQRQGQGQGRPRSESPATHHHHHMHNDLRHDSSKGKSATPPPSHGNGREARQRGPPPPPTPPPENLESFLFSDSPTGSPIASPRVRSNENFQEVNGSVARSNSDSSSGNSGVGSAGGRTGRRNGGRGDSASAKAYRRKGTSGGKSGEDLLNFGNDSHTPTPPSAAAASPAPAGRSPGQSSPPQQPPPPPPRPSGWGSRPGGSAGVDTGGSGGGGGSASPDRISTGGRVQGRASTGMGAPSNGRPGSKGPSGSSAKMPNGNGGRPMSFAGVGGGSGDGGPDLMNVNLPGGGGGAGAGKSSYVASKMEEREQGLKEAAQIAVQRIKDNEAAAAKDQDDLDAAKDKYGAVLTAWAEDHGKKRNVRTLLSTMHTVLWEGNRWKTVSMGDIIQPSKVKLAYRKAMLLVHPDKCGMLGPEERLIAKRVFEAVNEAYTVFAEKEM